MINLLVKNNFFLLIVLSSIWGSAFIAIKVAVSTINPISLVALRLIIGATFLLIYFKISKKTFVYDYKTYFYIFLIALIGNFIPFYLISWSEIYIPSNLAGLLLSIAPIFAIILSHFFTKDDKFNLLKLSGILIGLIGTIFLLGLNDLSLFFEGNFILIPKFAIILAALGYVISSIIAYNLKRINILALTTLTTSFAALISLPFSIIYEFNNYTHPSLISLVSVFYLGIMPTAIAFLLRFHLISKAGPVFLSYVAYLIPIFAIFWGYVFLGEIVKIEQTIAIVFIFIGIYVGQKGSNVKNDLL